MAFVTAEDALGELEAILFPKVYARCETLLQEGCVLLFEGEAELKEAYGDESTEELKLLVSAVSAAEPSGTDAQREGERLYIKVTERNRIRFEDAIAILAEYPGSQKILVYFEPEKKLRALKDAGCAVDESLLRQLRLIMGEQNVAVR